MLEPTGIVGPVIRKNSEPIGPFFPVGPLQRQGLFSQSDADGLTGWRPAGGFAIAAAGDGGGGIGGGIVGRFPGGGSGETPPYGDVVWARIGPAPIAVVSNTPANRCFALMPSSRNFTNPTRTYPAPGRAAR